MRNLKKILALVLALVMSLSLMATAGAADFSDKDQISDKYSDAVTVLNGLEVFKGYDNGARFEPQGDITRAEVAAIIYRIATGDVSDTQKDIYSTWGLFTDVADGSWYAGYVNYCANAGYIKGRGNKIFDPNGKVTGYEALAMILRAIGYDKNNEFSGSNWQVNTASIAKQRGITNNITDTLLGQAATREVVAEILFQAILVPTVTFNTATISYTNNATSLGKDVLNLDKVTGVVVANEYANVQDDDLKVLAEGKTQLRVAAGDVRTLDLGTDLNDVGMSENAYIQGSKVLLISEADNTVFDNTDKNGEHVDISSASKFSSKTGMSKNDSTEFFVNFDHSTKHEANRRIEIRVTFNELAAEKAFDSYSTVNISKVAVDNGYSVYVNGSNEALKLGDASDYEAAAGYGYPVEYVKVFRVDDEVKDDDLSVIKGIFGMADDEDGTTWKVSGSVYVGTSSRDYDLRWNTNDKSDTMSFKAFKEEYIDTDLIKNWEKSNDGEWVKVIDNNGDGVAEYAFKTTFTLDKAVNTYTKNDESTLRYYALDLINGDVSGRYMNTVAEGDIVLHTTIDDQALIWKAEIAEDEVSKINDIYSRKITATTKNGTTYSQSEISNATRLDQRIEQMSETVNYRMYLDAFGRIRAYEPVDGTKYALITELYYGNYQNNRYVVNDRLTAEMKAGDAALTERVVNNPLNNDFILNFSDNAAGRDTWTQLNNTMNTLRTLGYTTDYIEDLYVDIVDSYRANVNNWYVNNWSDNVILQPAVAHLGFNGRSYAAQDIFRNATTNIARYVVNADGTVNLSTAAQLNYNANGSLSTGYAVDYVELDAGNTNSVRKGQNVFTGVNVGEKFNSNVDAVNETEFYIVANGAVEHFVGYKNLPAVSGIRSMYAVARNTTTDLNNKNYWVADVIVIESDTYTAQPDDYLFILGRADYYNNTQSNRQAVGSQNLLAISSVAEDVVRITPADLSWGIGTITPGFYKAYGVNKLDDGTYSISRLSAVTPLDVNDATTISANTSNFKLRAGTVTKTSALNDRIEVRLGGTGNVEQLTLQGPALAVIQNASGYVSTSTRLSGDNYSNLVINNRDILWVEDGNGNARFLIDVTWSVEKSASNSTLASILRKAHTDVSTSQLNPISSKDYTITVEYLDTTANRHNPAPIKRYVNNGNELTLTGTELCPTGYERADAVFTVLNTKTGTAAHGNGCYVVGNDASALLLRNITADLTVRINVTAKDYTAKLNEAWSVNNGAKLYASCTGSVNLNVLTDTSSKLLDNTTGVNVHAGDTVTVGFMADYDGYSVYKLVVKDSKGNEIPVNGTSRTGVYSFVMPADAVTLYASYAAETFKVNFVGDGVTVKNEDGTAAAAEATPGEEYKFTATPKAGYVLKSITYAGNGKTGTLTNSPYTIGADAVAKGLTVTFNTELKEFDVTLRTTGVAPTVVELGNNVSRDYKDQTIQSIISFTVNAKSDVIDVSTSTGGTIRYTETGYNTTLVTVTGMTGAGDIDVTTKQ